MAEENGSVGIIEKSEPNRQEAEMVRFLEHVAAIILLLTVPLRLLFYRETEAGDTDQSPELKRCPNHNQGTPDNI